MQWPSEYEAKTRTSENVYLIRDLDIWKRWIIMTALEIVIVADTVCLFSYMRQKRLGHGIQQYEARNPGEYSVEKQRIARNNY